MPFSPDQARAIQLRNRCDHLVEQLGEIVTHLDNALATGLRQIPITFDLTKPVHEMLNELYRYHDWAQVVHIPGEQGGRGRLLFTETS